VLKKLSGRCAGVTAFGKTTGRQRVTVSDIAEDRELSVCIDSCFMKMNTSPDLKPSTSTTTLPKAAIPFYQDREN